MAKTGKVPMRPEHQAIDVEDLAREMEESISQLRKRHETFQPMSPEEAARQKLFGAPKQSEEKGGRSHAHKPADRLSPEERRERFELLKFVRKIEPDLPPLERLPPSKEPPPCQALVEFNATSGALRRWRPEERRNIVAETAAEHSQRLTKVVRNAVEVKAAARARRKELAELRAVGPPPQNALGDMLDPSGQWLVLIVVAGLLNTMLTELKLRKLEETERCEYVMKHFDSLKKKNVPKSSMTGELVKYVNLTKHENFRKRVPLLTSYFLAKVSIKLHRKEARKLLTCLQSWRASGPMILQLKRIGVYVRRIQRWWRERADWLSEMHNVVTKMWLAAEHQILEAELRQMLSWCTHTEDREAFEARLDKSRVPKPVRDRFIENEMRARRYMLLPRIYIYEEERAHWREQLQEWRETREALLLMSNGEKPALPVFYWAPVEPSYMPHEDDVADMLARATTRPEGWTPIPQYNKSCRMMARKSTKRPSSRSDSRSPSRGGQCGPDALIGRTCSQSRATITLAARAVASEEEEEALLQRLGISPAHMPCGLTRPPPPTNECEDSD